MKVNLLPIAASPPRVVESGAEVVSINVTFNLTEFGTENEPQQPGNRNSRPRAQVAG
jgi:hypothetical protein